MEINLELWCDHSPIADFQLWCIISMWHFLSGDMCHPDSPPLGPSKCKNCMPHVLPYCHIMLTSATMCPYWSQSYATMHDYRRQSCGAMCPLGGERKQLVCPWFCVEILCKLIFESPNNFTLSTISLVITFKRLHLQKSWFVISYVEIF